MRRILPVLVLLVTVGAVGCSTADSIFPRTGSLKPQVLDLTLSTQTSAEPSNQFLKWTVTKAEADVPGHGTVNFLDGGTECVQVQQIFSFSSSSLATCRFRLSGLALEAGTTGTATVRLEISGLKLVRAERPLLTDGADFDLDGVPDESDNCPYVANADQANENAAAEGENPVGDACTNANGAKDSDADTVADVADNCVYVANPQQQISLTDGFADTVGDACKERIDVTLPGARLLISQSDVPFTIRDGGITFVRFDFRSKDWCPNDAQHPPCLLTAADVTVSVQ